MGDRARENWMSLRRRLRQTFYLGLMQDELDTGVGWVNFLENVLNGVGQIATIPVAIGQEIVIGTVLIMRPDVFAVGRPTRPRRKRARLG